MPSPSPRLASLFVILAALPALADPPPAPVSETPREDRLVLSTPLVQYGSYPISKYPSWEQAVSLSTDATLLADDAVQRLTDAVPQLPRWLRGIIYGFGTVGADLLAWLVAGPDWAHEEGHRAVLARYSISSNNGVIDPPGSWPPSYRPVYGVTDASLASLKENHNPDMVRLQSAGWESELQLKWTLERSTFFADRRGAQNLFAIAYVHLSVIYYFTLCIDQRQTEQLTQDEYAVVWTDVYRRDFTGPDCTGWAYDLNRPNEPYAARGLHPSGVGIRRDRLPSDLSSAEYSYLRRTRNLLFLNLVDPAQYGFSGFRGTDPLSGRPFRWTAALAYTPTSFGAATDVRLLVDEAGWKLGATLTGYTNGDAFFPGLSAELFRHPIHPFGHPLSLSASASLWLQPYEQRFHTRDAAPGGLLAVTVSQRLFDALDLDLRLRGKTAGWAPLHANLDPAVDLTLGASLLLP